MADRLFAPTATPGHHPAIETALFDDDQLCAVVFDETSRSVHRFGGVTCAVWILCDGRTSVEAIIGQLSDLLSCDGKMLAADVAAALDLLWSAGLVVDHPEPANVEAKRPDEDLSRKEGIRKRCGMY